MKKLLLTSILAISTVAVFAQNTTCRYKLNNRMNDEYFAGPDLIPGCSTGTYSWKSLPVGVSKYIYSFEKGCGLYFNDSAGFLSAGTYTIELYFMLDTVKGFRKLIDYDSLGADAGLYNHNSNLQLYPNSAAGDSVILPGEYQYVAITRDGSSKEVKIYTKDTLVGTYNDNSDKYIYGSDKIITFFEDDNNTSNHEQSGGAVSMIYISNYVMDSATVVGRYSDLPKILNVPGVNTATGVVKMYPNPAGDFVNINTAEKYNYGIYTLTGKKVTGNVLHQGNNRISLDGLPSGMYLLQLLDMNGAAAGVYKLNKR